MIEIMRDSSEGVGLLIPSFEDEDRTMGVISEVVHAGDEDSSVW